MRHRPPTRRTRARVARQLLRVPTGYTSPDGYHLGAMVASIRAGRHVLTEDQRQMLVALGFDFTPPAAPTTEQDIREHFEKAQTEILRALDATDAVIKADTWLRCRCTGCGYEYSTQYTRAKQLAQVGQHQCPRCRATLD